MQDELETIFFKINTAIFTLNQGTEALVGVLSKYNPTSIELHAYESETEPQCRPQNNGAIALANALKKHPGQIDLLALTRCDIGDEGAIAIVEALPYTKIKTLDLSSNANQDGDFTNTTLYLTSSSVDCLAKTLPNTQLAKLNFSYNHVNSDSLIAIAQVLYKTKITNLNFHNCIINKDCVIAFTDALIHAPQILEIDLDCDFHEDEDPCHDLITTMDHELKKRRQILGYQIAELLFLRKLPKKIEQTLFNMLPGDIFDIILRLTVEPHTLTPKYKKGVEECVQRSIDDQSNAGRLTVVPESFHERNRYHFFLKSSSSDVSSLSDTDSQHDPFKNLRTSPLLANNPKVG